MYHRAPELMEVWIEASTDISYVVWLPMPVLQTCIQFSTGVPEMLSGPKVANSLNPYLTPATKPLRQSRVHESLEMGSRHAGVPTMGLGAEMSPVVRMCASKREYGLYVCKVVCVPAAGTEHAAM